MDVREHGIVIRTLNTQGRIEPGTEGYWEVWGAIPSDIQERDLVIMKFSDGEVRQDQINKIIPEDDLWGSIRVRYINHDGQDRGCGRLVRVWIFRRGTHHTLSRYAH